MNVGRRRRLTLYRGVRALPGPVKRLGKGLLGAYARVRAAFGRNRFAFEHDGREIGYRYLDAPSLVYLANCIENGVVTHEEVPVELFDLPEYYDVAMDVGAHFGVYSVLLGTLNDVDLYCFEPNSENRRVLETNLAENGVDAVVDGRVVSDRTEPVTFYHRQGFDSVSHARKPPTELRDQFVRTETESVAPSSVLADHDDANVFAKIDAEGEEGRIVRDLLAADGIDVLTGFLEVHREKLPHAGKPILEALEREGFDYERVKHNEARPGYWFTNAADRGRESPFGSVAPGDGIAHSTR